MIYLPLISNHCYSSRHSLLLMVLWYYYYLWFMVPPRSSLGPCHGPSSYIMLSLCRHLSGWNDKERRESQAERELVAGLAGIRLTDKTVDSKKR